MAISSKPTSGGLGALSIWLLAKRRTLSSNLPASYGYWGTSLEMGAVKDDQ